MWECYGWNLDTSVSGFSSQKRADRSPRYENPSFYSGRGTEEDEGHMRRRSSKSTFMPLAPSIRAVSSIGVSRHNDTDFYIIKREMH
jgi:hypothetical protein